jgi:heterodisulfide reductase subunit C
MFRGLLLQAYIECAAKCSGLCTRSAYPAIYVTGILARFDWDAVVHQQPKIWYCSECGYYRQAE